MSDLVNRAFLFALKVHGDQQRKDGKPYIVHPFAVATEPARNGSGVRHWQRKGEVKNETDESCAGV